MGISDWSSAVCSSDLAAVDLGQVEVEQHDRRQVAGVAMRVFAAREQVVERLRAVADHLQAVGHVGLGEVDAGQFAVVRVVLDQQDVFLAHARFPDSATAGSSQKKVLPEIGKTALRRKG